MTIGDFVSHWIWDGNKVYIQCKDTDCIYKKPLRWDKLRTEVRVRTIDVEVLQIIHDKKGVDLVVDMEEKDFLK